MRPIRAFSLLATDDWASSSRNSRRLGFEVVGRLAPRTTSAVLDSVGARRTLRSSFSSPLRRGNLPKFAARKINVVIGTTGGTSTNRMKKIAADADIGVVAAPNFSLGVALFSRWRSRRQSCSPYRSTALDPRDPSLDKKGRAVRHCDHTAPGHEGRWIFDGIDMASSRAGSVPGTHTVASTVRSRRLR